MGKLSYRRNTILKICHKPKSYCLLGLSCAHKKYIYAGLGYYKICPAAVEQVMVMNNSLMDLVYTQKKRRLKKPPDIVIVFFGLMWLYTQTTSRIASIFSLQGRHLHLHRIVHDIALTRTVYQEGPINFDSSTCYTLWYSGYKNSSNTYFYLYSRPLVIRNNCLLIV